MSLTHEQLIDFMRDDLGIETDEVGPDTLIFSDGVVDSFALVEIIGFIEESCGIEVDPLDVSLENFDSLSRMCSFVNERAAA